MHSISTGGNGGMGGGGGAWLIIGGNGGWATGVDPGGFGVKGSSSSERSRIRIFEIL